MKEFMALQSAFWFELFPTHITKVSFLCAVTIHVSFQVALAASGILTEGTFEGFDTWNKKKIYHEISRLCLSMRVDICLKEISDHVNNMDKEKHFKIQSSTNKEFHL